MTKTGPAHSTRWEQVLGIKVQKDFDSLRNAEAGRHGLVLGNSPWRLGFPVAAWDGPVIGCNALYRDMLPDYLVVVDADMIAEVITAGVAKATKLILREGIARAHVLASVEPEKRGGWYVPHGIEVGGSAGAFAIALAGWIGCASITLAGFACDERNIYLGTANYAPPRLKDTRGKRPHEPGGKETEVIRLRKGFAEYRRLSPEGMVFMVTPGEWGLDAIAAHYAHRRMKERQPEEYREVEYKTV